MKKPSKQPWKVLSTSALAAVLSLSMVVPVFAADGDIMDRTTHNPYLATTYRSNTAVCNSLIDSLINSLDTFTYEFGGKNYEYHAFSDRVTSLIDTGITAPQAKSQAASTMQEYTEPGSALSVQNVAAINGTVTVTMNSAPATAPVLADFAVTNAGVAVVPTAIVTTGTVVTLTVPAIAATAADQSVVYSVSYKGATAVAAPAFTVTKLAVLAVSSVSAINGTVTVTMNSAPATAPVLADFAVTNAGVAVVPTAIVTTGTVVTLTVPAIAATAADQSVVYSVSYKGATAVAAPAFTVTPAGFTFKTVLDALTGNTIVNVTVTDSNVTGVTVQGLVANNIGSQVWRASLPGTGTIIPVSASDITLTTSTTPTPAGFTFKTVLDALTGNTIVNVTATDSNVTGVTVQGLVANNIGSQVWRASLPGTGTIIPVSASDITLTTSTTPVAVNAIDMTKTVATKELFNDVFYQVYLLSGVTPSSVMSVTVTDVTGTTVLPYITANGNYNVDIPYTGTLPTSVSVAVTTAAGTQTVTVPVTN